MNDNDNAVETPLLPPDDLTRRSVIANPDGDLRHVSIVGDTYTILLDGEQTQGKYCLIDMLVPQNGGPPPHRHDFEETFIVLEGAIEVTFRGESRTVSKGETAHVPANAPHQFTNVRPEPARLLCICAPAGQEDLFLQLGDLVPTRTSPPPDLDEAERAARMARALALAPKFKTEFLLPPHD